MTQSQILTQLFNSNHLSESELNEAQEIVNRLQNEINSRKPQKIDFTRIDNDTNGNPRYVCHFLNLLTKADDEELKGNISGQYERALKNSRELRGKKFNNKQYGGGIAFQFENLDDLQNQINEVVNK